MKLALILLLAVGASLQAADTTPKVVKKKAAPKPVAPKPIQPITIPKGAVKTDDGYRVVDAKGKVWIYRETPFGVTKAAYIAPAPKAAPGASDENVVATDAGESVSFRRTSPFGTTTWQKKKTELSPDELAIWNRQKK